MQVPFGGDGQALRLQFFQLRNVSAPNAKLLSEFLHREILMKKALIAGRLPLAALPGPLPQAQGRPNPRRVLRRRGGGLNWMFNTDDSRPRTSARRWDGRSAARSVTTSSVPVSRSKGPSIARTTTATSSANPRPSPAESPKTSRDGEPASTDFNAFGAFVPYIGARWPGVRVRRPSDFQMKPASCSAYQGIIGVGYKLSAPNLRFNIDGRYFRHHQTPSVAGDDLDQQQHQRDRQHPDQVSVRRRPPPATGPPPPRGGRRRFMVFLSTGDPFETSRRQAGWPRSSRAGRRLSRPRAMPASRPTGHHRTRRGLKGLQHGRCRCARAQTRSRMPLVRRRACRAGGDHGDRPRRGRGPAGCRPPTVCREPAETAASEIVIQLGATGTSNKKTAGQRPAVFSCPDRGPPGPPVRQDYPPPASAIPSFGHGSGTPSSVGLARLGGRHSRRPPPGWSSFDRPNRWTLAPSSFRRGEPLGGIAGHRR